MIRPKQLTAKQYYAGQALAGICANPMLMSVKEFDNYAKDKDGGRAFAKVALAIAEEMIKEEGDD